MKQVYWRPETEVIRLRLSSSIADEMAGPGYTTSRTVDPGAMESKRSSFQYDNNIGDGAWADRSAKSIWE